MSAQLVQLDRFRKQKSKARVFEALEQFYQEVLIRLEDQNHQIAPEEFEEFMVQVLGDHLVGRLESSRQTDSLDHHYKRFDERLKACLKTKLKTLSHFEQLQRKR